ncbi:MAG: V-type ATPase subunit [Synergistaceae bacterium]|nr:V-type ATPase subunit [Synergistaceae bacterium]
MSNKEAYGYAVARIRAMEQRLLDAAVFARLLDADDTASILKILGETSYASVLTSVSGDTAFDKILETALHDTYEELDSFVPDKELVSLLRLQYDFSNVKVMLKSIFNVRNGGKKRWDLLTSLASYPVDRLIADIESEDYQLLPFGLNTLFPKCISIWEQNRDVLETERLLDRQMFEVMLKEAEKLAMPEILSWVRTRIDGENIRSLLRLKRFGFDAARAWPFMHEGGKIDLNILVPMISEPFETWGRIVDFSDFSRMLASIDGAASFDDIIMDLERDLDDFYLDSIADSKYSPDAPGNVIAYLWAKEMEVKNIRMIIVSKTNKKDKDQVRRLLRHVYV